MYQPCISCKGAVFVNGKRCTTCKGSGTTTPKDESKRKAPATSNEGSKERATPTPKTSNRSKLVDGDDMLTLCPDCQGGCKIFDATNLFTRQVEGVVMLIPYKEYLQERERDAYTYVGATNDRPAYDNHILWSEHDTWDKWEANPWSIDNKEGLAKPVGLCPKGDKPKQFPPPSLVKPKKCTGCSTKGVVAFTPIRIEDIPHPNRCLDQEHHVLGENCIKCGWKLRILNVYIPEGLVSNPELLDLLVAFSRADTKIVSVQTVADNPPTINEVGFNMRPLDKMYLTVKLGESLMEAPKKDESLPEEPKKDDSGN